MRIFALFLALFFSFSPLQAQEVQQHGVIFEKWIRDTFFEGYQPEGYTQKWDIPAHINKKFGGIPVNPKATKYKTPVDLGDAMRQFQINEPFYFLIGYWEQREKIKKFVNVVAVRVEPETYKKLWGDIQLSDLEKLDSVIKNTPDYREARKLAQEMKKSAPFNSSIITLNPKIDSKGQRRLQCSLSFKNVFQYLAPAASPEVQEKPILWEVPVELEIESGPRGSKAEDE